MKMTITFDMDGTLADLYGQENWLDDLRAERVNPYANARPLVNLQALAKRLNNLQKQGYKLAVVSWGSKASSINYLKEVEKAKREWLAKHLSSVNFDDIAILEYGTPKSRFNNGFDILFDDEEKNRTEWGGLAFDEKDIIEILQKLK